MTAFCACDYLPQAQEIFQDGFATSAESLGGFAGMSAVSADGHGFSSVSIGENGSTDTIRYGSQISGSTSTVVGFWARLH